VVLVTLPEETPVNELVDTAYTLEDRVGVQLGPVVVNAMPADLALAGRSTVEDAATIGVQIPAADARALDEAAAFRLERHELAWEQAKALADRLPLPQLHLPFLFGEIGPTEIDQLADALVDEVAALPTPDA
jgi:hypothetical protein